MCRELWNFCWSYRFYETKSQRCNVRNSILFSYSVIFNVLSEDLIMDEFGGNSFFGLGELEELYEWIMSNCLFILLLFKLLLLLLLLLLLYIILILLTFLSIIKINFRIIRRQ